MKCQSLFSVKNKRNIIFHKLNITATECGKGERSDYLLHE